MKHFLILMTFGILFSLPTLAKDGKDLNCDFRYGGDGDILYKISGTFQADGSLQVTELAVTGEPDQSVKDINNNPIKANTMLDGSRNYLINAMKPEIKKYESRGELYNLSFQGKIAPGSLRITFERHSYTKGPGASVHLVSDCALK